MLDQRTYRGKNSTNRQTALDADSAFLGKKQLAWLKRALKRSKATWKVIAADMPLALIIGEEKEREALANGDPGLPSGRELEMQDLLGYLKAQKVQNVIWLTADVHYAAAHEFRPERAAFKDFDPFWEFIAGALHAGNFGPNTLDGTFGPEAVFSSAKPGDPMNRPPWDGALYFGQVSIEPGNEALTVQLIDLAGTTLFSKTLEPIRHS
jgi:alkaline phosphatase D